MRRSCTWEDGLGASGEVEDIGEPVLAKPGGGYQNKRPVILPHLAQDLWKQRHGRGGTVEVGGPGEEKVVAL